VRDGVAAASASNGELVPLALPQGNQGRQVQSRVPLSFVSQRARWTNHNLGRLDIRCTGCDALHWTAESSASRKSRGGEASFESCCKQGKVQIQRMRPLPEPLNALMSGGDTQARAFREGLRRWNSIFAFTSIKFNMDNRMSEIGGIFQLFQIHGALYHRQGPLVPAVGMGDALYSQVYLYDPADAARARAACAPELNANLIRSLTLML